MTPFKYKLTINQGETFTRVFTWKVQPTESSTPVAVDLTGCTAAMQIRARVESTDLLIELSTENGRIELGGPDGSIALKVSAADTASIQWRAGVYDLEIAFQDGTVRRLIAGQVTVSPEVTRAV